MAGSEVDVLCSSDFEGQQWSGLNYCEATSGRLLATNFSSYLYSYFRFSFNATDTSIWLADDITLKTIDMVSAF